MSGSDVLVRVAGRAVIREICVARVPRQRCCSHVVDISQTDIVVAIDVFGYVTRAHTHTHTHRSRGKNQMKWNSTRIEVLYGYLRVSVESVKFLHIVVGRNFGCAAVVTERTKNVASQQKRRRLTESWMTWRLKWTLSPLSSKISTFITLCFVG